MPDHEARIAKLEQQRESDMQALSTVVGDMRMMGQTVAGFGQTLGTLEKYMHDSFHAIRGELQPIKSNVEISGKETLHQTDMLKTILNRLGILEGFWPRFWSKCFWILVVAGAGVLGKIVADKMNHTDVRIEKVEQRIGVEPESK